MVTGSGRGTLRLDIFTFMAVSSAGDGEAGNAGPASAASSAAAIRTCRNPAAYR